MGHILTVPFAGAELYGFSRDGGRWVALKPVARAVGLDWEGQRQRTDRDPLYRQATCKIQAPFGSGQDELCLRLEFLPGWLLGINSGQVKDEAKRERIQEFQAKAHDALYRAFMEDEGELPRASAMTAPTAALPIGEARKLVDCAHRAFGPIAAREVWFATGLIRTASMVTAVRQLELFPHEYRPEGSR